MMRMRTKNDVLPPDFNVGPGGGRGAGRGGAEKEWELRPGGMLVQKRTDGGESRVPPPTIRVRVKYGSIYHEIRLSSQSTFGNSWSLPHSIVIEILAFYSPSFNFVSLSLR